MKQLFSLILTTLMICGTLPPAILTANEYPAPNNNPADDTYMDASSTSSSAITLVSFEKPDNIYADAFPQGTSQEELLNRFENVSAYFVGYDALGNEYDLMSSAWSLDDVDTNTLGVYYAWAEPDLKDEYILEDGVALPRERQVISIQTPGKLDINCSAPGRGFLRFPWVFSLEQAEQLHELEQLGQQDTFATVWLRQNNEEWIELSQGFIFVADSLHLSQRIFEYENTYDLQVDYPGGKTGVLTFQYEWPLNIIKYAEGDRDGGDVSGGELPTGSQPAPLPNQPPSKIPGDENVTPVQDKVSPMPNKIPVLENEPPLVLDLPLLVNLLTLPKIAPVYAEISSSQELEADVEKYDIEDDGKDNAEDKSESKVEDKIEDIFPKIDNKHIDIKLEPIPNPPESIHTVIESYSPEQTVISGLRLHDLCADTESVVFGSGDLTISIPSTLLLALNLSDSDSLSVRLTIQEKNQLTLKVEASGKPITELPGAILRMRYVAQSKDAEVTARNGLGEEITDAFFDGEFLRFTANTSGTYTVFETSKAEDIQKAAFPLLPLSASLILTVGGITLFRRKYFG